MSYAFDFQGKVFTPDGKANLAPSDVDTANRQTEQTEIERIRLDKPDKLFLYIGHKPMDDGLSKYSEMERERGYDLAGNPLPQHVDVGKEFYTVQTWLGTRLGWAWIGEHRNIGFGWHTYRRAVTVRMFGTLYHGWYYESSGDYCRLTKAKRQDGKYGASRWFDKTSARS